jgi:hypothetical protein
MLLQTIQIGNDNYRLHHRNQHFEWAVYVANISGCVCREALLALTAVPFRNATSAAARELFSCLFRTAQECYF